jgi:hypothetical protein
MKRPTDAPYRDENWRARQHPRRLWLHRDFDKALFPAFFAAGGTTEAVNPNGLLSRFRRHEPLAHG